MMMKDKYYTYQDILNLYPNYAPEYPHDSSVSSSWFTSMLNDANMKLNVIGLDSTITTNIINGIINNLMTIVYNRHDDDFFYKVTQEAFEQDYDLVTDDFKKAMKPLVNIINLTAPRYIPLFQQNAKYSSDPLAKMKSSSTGRTRFNNTPQESGDFNDDQHSTNASFSYTENEIDSGSIVERLDELFKNYKSIILMWANEFNVLFLKEAQIW